MKKVSNAANPLISVVVPVYKVEEYLNRCVDSIINQAYKNLEIILVDDGSPDNCGKMCDEFSKKDKRIKVIHKENGGLSDARNKGIECAIGDYITFIDSDDYIEKNYITVLYDVIQKDNTDMAIGAHTVIYENGIVLKKATGEKLILEPKEVLERILYDDGVDLSAWAKLYKTELFKKIRYPKSRLFEDAATTYKLIDECNKISITSVSIYNYIIRNNSITNESFSTKKMDLIISTQEMCDYVKEKYPDLEKACNRRLMYAYLSTLTQLAKAKKDKTLNFNEHKKKLMDYIRENRKEILKDKRIPKRDQIGLYCTIFGFKFYKVSWNLYSKIRK